jgi:hypothetical protein
MPVRRAESHPPEPRAIRAGLDRIEASRPFDTSPMLMSFLRFVVESTLAGRGGRLKGYTIGVEALGRGENFNPQIDPIVRVEAIRLRAALARYYSGAGVGDPIVIEIPRGHYVPCFTHRRRRGGPGLMTLSRAVHAIRYFLMLRVTIQVRAAAGKLAAPGPRLLRRAAIAQAPTPDGRQEQQAEATPAARTRRSRTG